MEPMEDVFRYEAEARGKKNRELKEILSFCLTMVKLMKSNPKEQEQILDTMEKVLREQKE